MGDGFLVRRGGEGLNFSVIGSTSQPSSPSENTIWINTSTAITKYVFSVSQPSSPTAGMVWIKTAANSNNVFSAIKTDTGNALYVYPLYAKQYISSAWTQKTAKIYQNSAWSSWWNGELYDAIINDVTENEMPTYTGSWTATGIKYKNYNPSSVYSVTPTLTRELAGLTASIYGVDYTTDTSGSSGTLRTTNAIDLTNYSTITVKGSFGENTSNRTDLYVIADATKNEYATNAKVIAQISASTGTGTINVSSLSGSYYVCIGLYTPRAKTLAYTMTKCQMS